MGGLRAIDLRRYADDGARLLDGVSISLAPGDRVALCGPSGGGKSLLLRALVLLDPVDDGCVEWQGSTPQGDLVPAFRRQVLYLQQRPMVTEAEVAAQLELPWTFKSAGGRPFERERALSLLGRAGRGAEFLGQAGANLSGGEAQLLAMVRALMLEPLVLLLDEPTSAMDQSTRQAAESLLEEWIEADARRAWIWVSHDAAQLARVCGRQIVLEAGTVVA